MHSLWDSYVTWQEHRVKCAVQISTHNTAQSFKEKFRPVWLNGWVFVYKLIGCGFESSCSHFIRWRFKFKFPKENLFWKRIPKRTAAIERFWNSCIFTYSDLWKCLLLQIAFTLYQQTTLQDFCPIILQPNQTPIQNLVKSLRCSDLRK